MDEIQYNLVWNAHPDIIKLDVRKPTPFGATHKLTENALYPITKLINEDLIHCCSQYQSSKQRHWLLATSRTRHH